MPPTWFTISEASQHAKTSRTALYELIRAGAIVPRKLGRRTLISHAELDALIESGAPTTKVGQR